MFATFKGIKGPPGSASAPKPPKLLLPSLSLAELTKASLNAARPLIILPSVSGSFHMSGEVVKGEG